jgi:hypothetical protein
MLEYLIAFAPAVKRILRLLMYIPATARAVDGGA